MREGRKNGGKARKEGRKERKKDEYVILSSIWKSVGGFFLSARTLGEGWTIHSPPAFFFFKVEISSRTLISVFTPGSIHSGSTS